MCHLNDYFLILWDLFGVYIYQMLGLCQQAAIKFLLHMCICISPTPSLNALAFQKSGAYHQVARLCLIHSFSIFGLFIHESFGCQDIQFLLKLF